MFEVPSMFRPPSMFGPPTLFSGITQAATNVESAWCLSFDGSNDFVSVYPYGGGGPLSAIGTGDFTIAMWASRSSLAGGYRAIYGNIQRWTAGIVIGQNTAKFGGYLGTTSEMNSSFTVPTDGSWHHYAVTRSSGTVTLWVDGVADATTYYRPASLSSIEAECIGTAPGYNYWAGKVDDVRIYSSALSATEIGYLANNTQNVTTGLAAYLPLEEGTGTTTAIKDSTGATIATGTLTNGPTWHPQTPPKLASGRETLAYSLSFDGSNDSVSIPGSSFPTASGSPFSVSAWVYVSSTTGFPMILCKGAVNSAWLLFLDASTKQIYLLVIGATFAATGANHIVTPSNAIASNTWHHVAIVWTCTSATIYVNGVAVATSSATDTNQSWGSSNLYFASAVSSNYMAGRLCNSGFYSRAISSTEVARLARGQRPATDDPVGRWKLNETSGTTVIDYSGNGNNGTQVNGPTPVADVSPWHQA